MAILIVEDDKDLGNLLVEFLKMNDFETRFASNVSDALSLAGKMKFDLAVIDVNLPDGNGFDLAKTFRKHPMEIPFLFLTVKNKKEDVLYGLKQGAEDYVTKPFDPEELVLRINIALRKNFKIQDKELNIGRSCLNLNQYRLYTPVRHYKLTPRECELLGYIIKNKNHVIKRDTLLKTLWGDNDYFLGRSMDVFISRLRKYFKDDPGITVETYRGVGYLFKDII